MKIAVLGYGKSGQAAVNLLKKKGNPCIDIFDDKIDAYENIHGFKSGIYDRVIISPGVDIRNLSIPKEKISSEIALAYEQIEDSHKIIAITGTNGKSTVTYITAQILSNMGKRAAFCGNIGKTFSEAIHANKYNLYILELSSFQIDLLDSFVVSGACITNITPDHTDRYESYEDYIKTKLSITKFVKNGGFVLLPDDDKFRTKTADFKGRKVYLDETLSKILKFDEKRLFFDHFYVDLENFGLYGFHNLINLSYALLIVNESYPLSGDCTVLISNIKGLPHRCEDMGYVNEVKYINDSKSTTVESTLAALRSSTSKTILMLGGRYKTGDFLLLSEEINRIVSHLILFGESSSLIYDSLSGRIKSKIYSIKLLKDAVLEASSLAMPGDTILFSPACSSFDSFNSFEERGECFTQYVYDMRDSKNAV